MRNLYSGSPLILSRGITNCKSGLLNTGDVIELTSRHIVYLQNNTKATALLRDHTHLQGVYTVTHTEVGGGGMRHDESDIISADVSVTSDHIYMHGHKVSCVSDCGKFNVSFYQTGSFTAMNTNVKPIHNSRNKRKLNT